MSTKSYEELYFETDKSKEIDDRINNLLINKKYLEVAMWFSTIFETEARILIALNEKIIRLLGETRRNNILKNFQARTADDLKNKTLGQLKNELDCYYKDTEIQKLLSDFIEYRNKIIHRIFETEDNLMVVEQKIQPRIKHWFKLRNYLLLKINESLKTVIDLNEKLARNLKRKMGKAKDRNV